MEKDYVTNWDSQVKKGILSFIVLNLLKERDCYGYELIDTIQKLSLFDVAEGTLYPLLDRLKKEELVTSKWVHKESGIPRKYYQISKKGETTLDTMREHWTTLAKTMDKLIRKNP
jgi:PadR family transcriptional regulator PadR